MSGLDIDGRHIRKGAADSVRRWVEEQGGTPPDGLDEIVERISRAGSTPLVVADGPTILGVIELKDVVKQGIREKFDEMRQMGIRTVMITGDNPLTAAAIAQEAGVDDYLAEATPEAKMALIRHEQEGGKLVAMTGDGTNDAPALAQADVGVAMNTGTTAAKEAGNMVDLDSNPTKLIDVVEIGKQLLITRGSLTTFSIANDVAKYFAIIPALFVATYPQLNTLNIMKLHSPQSAVLSAVIFNALVIVALIPLALRGVKFRAAVVGGHPAPQRLDLRRGRDHRPVHLHQAHRPHPRRPPRLLMASLHDRPPPPLDHRDRGLHRLLRVRLRLRRHRRRPGASSGTRPTARSRPTGRRSSARTGRRHELPGTPTRAAASSRVVPTTWALRREPKVTAGRMAATTPWWPTASRASPARPTWGPAPGAPNNTKALVAYWRTGREPHPRPRDHLGQRPRPRHHAAGRHRPDPDGLQGHRHLPVALRALITRQTTGHSWASWVALHRRATAERGAGQAEA